MIIAIDPGPTQTAYVELTGAGHVRMCGIEPNRRMRSMLSFANCDALAVEMIASYGMPVGKDVFETCVWIGVFIDAFKGDSVSLIYRKDVKLHLCADSRAKDANIRQALIDRYQPTGGGKTPEIGTKSEPGPLYHVKKDIWSALAVGLTYIENHKARHSFAGWEK